MLPSEDLPKKSFHPSTLKVVSPEKRLKPNDPKRQQNRYHLNLHVNHTRDEFVHNIVIPRGITVKIHGYALNEQAQINGLLITLFGNDVTPNVIEKRDLNDLETFANERLKVVRDNPYELKGIVDNNYNNIRTEVTTEEIAQKAYNMYKTEDDRVIGEL